MNLELYKYGLSNALKDIEDALGNALSTTNKNEKTKYISEAYGMVKAIDALVNEKEDEN